jgi:hypothetical protein
MFYIVIGAIRLADKWLVYSGLKLGLVPSSIAFLALGGKDACLAISLTLGILSLYNIFFKTALK